MGKLDRLGVSYINEIDIVRSLFDRVNRWSYRRENKSNRRTKSQPRSSHRISIRSFGRGGAKKKKKGEKELEFKANATTAISPTRSYT